ncbi:MAG: DUF5687 family protein [Bacteroidota bacterium]
MSGSSLFRSLVAQQWKQSTRSAYYEKGILMKIFISLMILYLAINLVVVGLFMGKILEGAFPDDDPAWAFSLILFYYFLADIILRFFLQPLPVLGIVPYLHLPVKRSALFNFLLLKSGLSLFNYFPLLILLPFTLRSVLPAWGGLYSLNWLAAVLLLIFSNNYLAFLLKKIYPGRLWIMPLLLLAAISLLVTDFKTHQAISGLFASTLTSIAAHTYLLLLPLIFLLILYLASWILLYKNRYLELTTKKERMLFSGNDSSLLASFGIPGKLALMEIKLILRNNRPRSFLMLSGMFLFYGLLIYPPHSRSAGEGMFLFVGLLITGIFMMQYGQLIMSWESRSFDKIVTSPLRMQDYFRGKFWFFFAANGISFLLTLPYVFYGYHIVLINLACFLYQSGINSFIILFLGTYNTKRIDLGKGAMFNYEGTSFIHFLLFLPLLGLPYLIWLPFSLLGYPTLGVAAIGLTGVAGLLFSQVFIRITVKQFNSRKYKILNGFRTS